MPTMSTTKSVVDCLLAASTLHAVHVRMKTATQTRRRKSTKAAGGVDGREMMRSAQNGNAYVRIDV